MSISELEKRIQDLEAKIEILEKENALLADRREDTLLLGIIAERINIISDISQVVDVGLENISLLKDIPFCAFCRLEGNDLNITNYYFSESNKPLNTTTFELPAQVRKKVLSGATQLDKDECTQVFPSIKFESKDFSSTSLLLIPTKSKLRKTELFSFANSSSNEKLSVTVPLLERIVEMISARIDNIFLVMELNKLNQALEQKVLGRTQELVNANKVLQEKEEKYRNLFNEALDMIHFIDKAGNIIDANPAELETLQYSRDEFIGKPLIDFIAPDFKEKTKNALGKLFSGEEIKAYHTVMLAKDGSRIEVEANVVPEMDEGQFVQTRAIIRNITDRKKMEDNILKIKKLESVGMLAGGIAHDFNNILAAILGNASLAKLNAIPGDKFHDRLSEIEQASLRAKDLTQQLLTFAKGGEPIKEVTSAEEVIKDSASFVLRGSNVRCAFRFSENLWAVEVDAGQISQVIQNLIINSRQSMPLGGNIEVVCENYSYDGSKLIPFKPGRYIKIIIKDHGTGIPHNMVDKIFDPYFSTKQNGSGLGLAVTHSIVMKHQGHIEVESRQGIGTTFTVFLPATEKKVKEYQEKSWVEYLDGKGKVMVMDDDQMVRTTAGAMLEKIGYEVVFAKDGKEAVAEYIKENNSNTPIDIIIMDLTIPGGMGGKEAANEILKINPEAKLIVSSGYSDDPIMANFQDYGFCSAMVKPYRLHELMTIVGQAMKESENEP